MLNLVAACRSPLPRFCAMVRICCTTDCVSIARGTCACRMCNDSPHSSYEPGPGLGKAVGRPLLPQGLEASCPLRQSTASCRGRASLDPQMTEVQNSLGGCDRTHHRAPAFDTAPLSVRVCLPGIYVKMQARSAPVRGSDFAQGQLNRRWRSACTRRRPPHRQAARPASAFGSGDPSLVTLPVFPLPNVLHPAQQGRLSGGSVAGQRAS